MYLSTMQIGETSDASHPFARRRRLHARGRHHEERCCPEQNSSAVGVATGELARHHRSMNVRSELQGEDPIALFQEWLKQAEATEPNDPIAAALATATPDGYPSVRMVLVKRVDERGFSFFTNAESRKGHDLEENPKAALCFHWKSLRRQVRVRGEVMALPGSEVDEYFHSRSRKSQIGAAVSLQSRPLPERTVLEQAVAQFTAEHAEGEIPRPDFWRGYTIHPQTIEFWMDGPDRLHDRRVFTAGEAGWTTALLYP